MQVMIRRAQVGFFFVLLFSGLHFHHMITNKHRGIASFSSALVNFVTIPSLSFAFSFFNIFRPVGQGLHVLLSLSLSVQTYGSLHIAYQWKKEKKRKKISLKFW